MYKKLAILTLTTFGFQGATYAEEHAHWGYSGKEGPSHWGELSPKYAECQNGRNQSPIDITNAVKSNLPPLKFDYHPIPLVIQNNGHTVQVTTTDAGTLTIGEENYKLVQFHYHTPSDEVINHKQADMVIHLVHKNDKRELAVVAVLLDASSQTEGNNHFVEVVSNNLPATPGEPQKKGEVSIDLNELLPKDLNYYAYEGSLTAPPCTEGVKWHILKHHVTLSKAELEKFSKLYPNNNRPVQPVGDRKVLSSD